MFHKPKTERIIVETALTVALWMIGSLAALYIVYMIAVGALVVNSVRKGF